MSRFMLALISLTLVGSASALKFEIANAKKGPWWYMEPAASINMTHSLEEVEGKLPYFMSKPYSTRRPKPPKSVVKAALEPLKGHLSVMSWTGTQVLDKAIKTMVASVKEWPKNTAGHVDVTEDTMRKSIYNMGKAIETAWRDAYPDGLPDYFDLKGIREKIQLAASDALKSTECDAKDSSECSTAQYKAQLAEGNARVVFWGDKFGEGKAILEESDRFTKYCEAELTRAFIELERGAGFDGVRKAMLRNLPEYTAKLLNRDAWANLMAESAKNVFLYGPEAQQFKGRDSVKAQSSDLSGTGSPS